MIPAPIFVTADSRLLFWREGSAHPFMDRVRQAVRSDTPRAAYIGASNGDKPEYYSVFEAAMEIAAIGERRMIRRDYPPADASFLESADLVLLAGGDVALGWSVLEETGMAEVIRARRSERAVLVGVSAGAVQLGSGYLDSRTSEFVATLGFVEGVLDAHDEENDWQRLTRTVLQTGEPGVGLPWGGGMVIDRQGREAVRVPVVQIRADDGATERTLLAP